MVVTGLLVRAAIALRSTDFGFEPEGVMVARIDLPESGYGSDQAKRNFAEELLLEAPPAARAFLIDGAEPAVDAAKPTAHFFTVTPGYFRTVRIPLLSGRTFERTDSETSPRVALVNETAAARFWPDVDPIGQRVHVGEGKDETTVRVVGVVGGVVDVSREDTSAFPPQFYLAFAQKPSARIVLVARAADDPSSSDSLRSSRTPSRLAARLGSTRSRR